MPNQVLLSKLVLMFKLAAAMAVFSVILFVAKTPLYLISALNALVWLVIALGLFSLTKEKR